MIEEARKYYIEALIVLAVVLLGVLTSNHLSLAQVSITATNLGLKHFVPMYSQTDGTYIYLFGYNNSANVAALAVYDPSSGSIVAYQEYPSWSHFDNGYVSPNAPYIYAFAHDTIVAINPADLSVVNSSFLGSNNVPVGAIYYEGTLYLVYAPVGKVTDWAEVAKCTEDAGSCTLGYASTDNAVSNTVTENMVNEFAVYEVGTVLFTAYSDNQDQVVVIAWEAATETIEDIKITGYEWLGADYDESTSAFLAYLWDSSNVVVKIYTYSAGTLTEQATFTCTPSSTVESFGFVKFLGEGSIAVGYLSGGSTYVDYFNMTDGSCVLHHTETVSDTRPYHAAEVLGGTLYYFVYSPTTYEVGVVPKQAIVTTTVTTTTTQVKYETVTTTEYVTVPVTTTVTETLYDTVVTTYTTTLYKTITSSYVTTITKGYTTTVRDTVTAWRTFTGLIPTVYTVTRYVPTTVTETVTSTTVYNVTETVTETSPSTTTYTTTYATTEPVVTTTTYVTTVTEPYTTTEYITTVVTEPWWVVTRVYPTTVTGVTTYVTTVTETKTLDIKGVIVPFEKPMVMGVTTVYEPLPVPVERTVTTTVYVPEVSGPSYMVYLFVLLFAVILAVLYLARRR